ncbi:MFS transporter [Oryzomicrobium sp.]|uniref:MFS transporter n=1 Tax=Oryzomicrobium sp. TaxID=1911578 RepID=UPI002FE0948D
MPPAASVSPATAPKAEAEIESTRIKSGTPEFRKVSRAMFVGGFSVFAMLHGAQPLMPMFSQEFDLSPASASGVVSVATAALAFALIPASILADRLGRKPIMVGGLALVALFTLISAASEGFSQLLFWRALQGMVLAGVPAVAMAYLSEEVEPNSLGYSMGLYIAGNSMGGMSGRLVASALGDMASWRTVMVTLGIFGLCASVMFLKSVPRSRHFTPTPGPWRDLLATLRRDAAAHLGDPGLRWLFALGFLIMGCFTSTYNYLAYHLGEAPFNLRPALAGAVFMVYLVGPVAATWTGRLADRLGRRQVMWATMLLMLAGVLTTLVSHLATIVLGVVLLTFGFFASHSVASSWVGRRATHARGLASALYLTFYYLGAGVLGWASGLAWGFDGWFGVAGVLALCLLAGVGIAVHLRRIPPPANA